MLGRREDAAIEDDAVLLSPNVDALSNFLVDGTYSGKKRNIIKKQLKKMVNKQQRKKEEEDKEQADQLDANTLHALSSLASLEQDIETLYVPISIVVDSQLSEKINAMDHNTKGGSIPLLPVRKKIDLNDMYRLLAGKKEAEAKADTDTDTEMEKTETPEASSSSFTSSTTPPEKKIIQNVLNNFTSKSNKSNMDVTNDDNDNTTNNTNTHKMVKLSTNEKELNKLSQKYKEIEDVGERTYQMLLDLGMIGK